MADKIIISEVTREGDWTVLALAGRLDRRNVPFFEEKAEPVLASCDKFAIDLKKVSYLSSAGIRILLRLAKKAKAEQKSFVLCGAEGVVKEVMEETHMDMIVTLCRDRGELG